MYSKNSEFKKFFFKSNQKILDFDKIWIENKIRNVRKFWKNSCGLNKNSNRKKIQQKIVWIRKNSKCTKILEQFA